MSDETRELEARIRAAYAGEEFPATEEELARIRHRQAIWSAHDRSYRDAWIAVAAVLVLGAVGALVLAARRPKVVAPAASLAADALLPTGLLAQGAPFPSFPVATATREIRPGEMTYAYLRKGEVFTDSTPVFRGKLVRSSWHDIPAWLILTSPSKDSPTLWRDSSWFDTTDVRQLARSVAVYNSTSRIVEEFRETEILRGFITSNGTTWTVIGRDDPGSAPGGYILAPDVLGMALRRAPIDRNWRGSIAMATRPYYSRERKEWYDLAVTGEETISVPAGIFECWKIQLGPLNKRGDNGIFFWVSKQQQWIVQFGLNKEDDGPFFRSILVHATEE